MKTEGRDREGVAMRSCLLELPPQEGEGWGGGDL